MNNYAFFIEIITKRLCDRAFLLQLLNHRGIQFAAAGHFHRIPDTVYNNPRLTDRAHNILNVRIVYQ
ncbi:hypothetical protein D3C77_580360 [compost metagenome]